MSLKKNQVACDQFVINSLIESQIKKIVILEDAIKSNEGQIAILEQKINFLEIDIYDQKSDLKDIRKRLSKLEDDAKANGYTLEEIAQLERDARIGAMRNL